MLLFTTPADRPDLDACISRIAAGDREALAGFYRQTRAAAYGFALSLLKNGPDAEDVLHDAYLRVWTHAQAYRSQDKPMAWLLSIVRNLALDCLRARQRTQPPPAEDLAYVPAVTAEDRLLLSALLEGLGEEERQIVVLHALGGMKHRETAALLDLPLPTVLSKYHRAMKKLRKALEGSQ